MKTTVSGIVLILLIVLFPRPSAGQSNPQFDITLRIDYSSAEQMLDFFSRRTYNTDLVANARGNKLAAATSIMLARTERPPQDFARQLELVRDDFNVREDIYGLKETKSHVDQTQKLLTEIRKRQLDRRVVATVQSFFPSDAKVSGTILVFVVVMGNEKAAAFVRWIVWNNESPVFVGENQGEQVIVLNLARSLAYNNDVNAQFIELLGTLAHECFHAVFGIYQQNSEIWHSFHQRSEPIWSLAEVVQNEGIAYYLSLQLQIGGQIPATPWFDATNRAMKNFNDASKELLAPIVQSQRARELILNANLSGSFAGNYGATAGLRIAYEIDTRLGRTALTETIRGGVKEFFGKYDTLCHQNPALPRLDEAVLKVLEQ
jgi:hypothetical protein